ncbi:hypothetical protein L1049_013636 [Liquidambar formosana]|uniref:Uncharacterized protein n=1 Tax=Liquidambar formosana TaxID=63359 RepID=A0AAP0WUG6_LIQFO
MESSVIRSERRGRKRRRKDVNNVSADRQPDPETKRRGVATTMRSRALVGRYVKKEFEGIGVFIGKIVYYDSGLYRVDYEDGDCEDLESKEVRGFLIGDDDFDNSLLARKKKLDALVLKKGYALDTNVVDDSVSGADRVVEPSLHSEMSCGGAPTNEDDGVQVDGDVDSSSDSCEYVRDRDSRSEAEILLVPPPLLPPSSGTVGVPEEYVSHLFSVYGFLRSFSIRLFLSPFGLDDFVGSLNCHVPNTLLDAVHVALMRALRRHLEMLSSDGSELAIKCLRCIDWSLLDTLTWPVYLVQYLIVMGYTKGPEWKGFYADVTDREYYTLSQGRKLMILQILCDDVLDSAELRAEIDMREESEVGIDSDASTTNPPDNGPRRVHPRYSKTSACKNQEAMEIIAESHEIKSPSNSNSLACRGTEVDADAGDVVLDGNGDECRVCGMDGTLLCCDGCPSAYHSRCIGVSKMSIPEGSWFCPECTINNIGPIVTIGTSLRGAQIFGIDCYEQVFLGTCNHLLVLKASIYTEPCLRYYNQNDIPKVLQALYSTVQHTALYSGICKAISQYWKIPENLLSLPERAVANEKVDAVCCSTSLHLSGNENHKILDTVEGENRASSIAESNVENVAVSCLETMTQTDLPSLPGSIDTTTKQVSPLMNTKLPEQIKMEPSMSTGSFSHQVDPSDLTIQSLADRSSVIDLATCTSGNSNSSNSRQVNGMCLTANISSQRKDVYHGVGGRGDRNSANEFIYMGSSFKSHAYINHYSHGDFAASAAANLAVLSSEENRATEAQASVNPRKVMSANILLQVKAFSLAALRFFWPNSEKKLVEVPRERCGWCLSCKAPATSKRGCLLNSAALNAIKGAMKILAGLRSIKSGEGSLTSIATYIIYMEESLSGLIVGPFLSASYRRHWRKQVEQASTCSAIKSLLLELEENIHLIALSGEWVKLVDDWSVESSALQSSASAVGATQKRGPSGKRNRKESALSNVTADGCLDRLNDFSWWRGRKLAKLIFQRGILPHAMIKKAARRGGSKKISGIYYAEDSEIPRRSRQFAWRTAVEMSKNASQLALQVRYLDLHVRWSDLVRPDQNLQDGKGPETEASAFRNALICDKKVVENKIRYGVAFGNQKHLPSRVMKNIIEVEQSQDGKDKYWFSETRIPLYLIKEYEQNVENVLVPSAKKALNVLSKLQRRQLKASRRDIFSYLMLKRDNLDKCSCASCQVDVILRNAVKCSECQGYCHEACTISSTVLISEEVEFLITCKQCYDAKALTQNADSNDSPTSPLPLQGQGCQNVGKVTKGAKHKGHNQPLASVGTLESCSELKPASLDSSVETKSRRRSSLSWGLIWRKPTTQDTGIDFRLKHILLRGNPYMGWSGPVCRLCLKPYNCDLMYIHCETCDWWFHGDAVELEESKIFNVVGFKCCFCRRIKTPTCPYADPDRKRPVGKKPRIRTSKQEDSEKDSVSGTISEQLEVWEPTTPMLPMKEEVFIPDDDPLLFSLSRVEQITEHNAEVDLECNTASGPGPQKLPVRRQVKREGDIDGISGNNPSSVELSTPLETNSLVNPKEEASSPQVEWDISTNGLEDTMMFDYEGLNYEDMEFEPQTYFSFTELLASEDGGELDGVDASGNELGNLENSSSAFLKDGVSEQYRMGTNNGQHKPTVQPDVNVVHCQLCPNQEPAPDLSCEICGLWIHSHCSPWVEPSSWGDSWRCGNCREWR